MSPKQENRQRTLRNVFLSGKVAGAGEEIHHQEDGSTAVTKDRRGRRRGGAAIWS